MGVGKVRLLSSTFLNDSWNSLSAWLTALAISFSLFWSLARILWMMKWEQASKWNGLVLYSWGMSSEKEDRSKT